MAALRFAYPPPTVFAPKAAHTGTVIMMHGLGDSADGWSFLGGMLSASLPHVKWVFPTAPTRPITCNMGMAMPGWYDIQEIGNINQQEDEQGIKDSAAYISRLVGEEVEKCRIPSNRVVVGGFSQGGAVSLMMLRQQQQLGGVVALSAYLPLRQAEPLLSPEMAAVPVFVGHGEQDNLVPFDFGQMTVDALRAKGANVIFNAYNVGHSANEQELQDLAQFLMQRLP